MIYHKCDLYASSLTIDPDDSPTCAAPAGEQPPTLRDKDEGIRKGSLFPESLV